MTAINRGRGGVAVLALASALMAATGSVAADPPWAAASPDGRVRIELTLADGAEPRFRVTFRGAEVVAPSRVGIATADGPGYGGPCEVVAAESRDVRESFTQITGKRRDVRIDARETTVRLRETAGGRLWDVVLRAADDGAAIRYRFPAVNGGGSLAVAAERTEFRFPPQSKAFALPLNGFTTSYEKRYETRPLGELPANWLLGLPLLLELPGGAWAAVTEANVNEYAGLYLAPGGDGRLSARLSPLPKEPAVAVRAALPHATPWRVVLLGDRAGRLVESDFVLGLNEPCAVADTSWVRPGKTTFPWWNAYHEAGVPFKPGLNTATVKHYIDFCSANGIEYHSLDGVGNTAWYGGPIVPYKGADPTRAVDGIDLPEVLRYANAKGVRLRMWMNWKAADKFMETAFPQYRAWGVEGVMLDFMDRDDQEMNRFARRAVALAAANRLTVTLHGCPKPTGLERTYPNLLTHEGVLNLEYDKWDARGVPPEHEVTVPFTRMLAGPLDFHQGSFRTVPPEAFRPRNAAPLVMGTPARTLASYVVYQNHLPMVADYPSAYRGHPGLPLLAAVPATWDDTRVLDGAVGEFVVIARRHGATWHVGAMTDRHDRAVPVPLDFLGPGRFAAVVVTDDASAEHGMTIRERKVDAAGRLELRLAPAGGAYVRLTRGD